jgi:hypothetical protein
MATGEGVVGDAEFAPIESCSEERQALLDGLLAVKRLTILLVDEVNSDAKQVAARPAAWHSYDPAPFEVDDDRVTARVLPKAVGAIGTPRRLAGADDRRGQEGDGHKAQQSGDVPLEEKSRDRIAPWK